MERLSDGLWREAAINLPRRLWNGTKYSYLFEPARTNVFLQSQTFENAAWTKNNVTVLDNNIAGPFLGRQASRFTITSTSGLSRVFPTSTPSTTTAVWAVSVFLKAGTFAGNVILRGDASGNTANVTYNLTTGVLTNSGANVIRSYVTNEGEGFVELTLVYNNTSGFVADLATNNTGTTDFFYFTQMQLELGSTNSSPIITTGSAVLRAADSPVLTNASALIGQQEGTILFDYVAGAASSDDLFSFGENITNNVGLFQTSNGSIRSDIYHNGVSIVLNTGIIAIANTRYRVVIRYQSGSFRIWINGVQVATNSSTFTIGAALSSVRLTKIPYFAGAQTNLLNDLQLHPVLTDAQSLALSQIPA